MSETADITTEKSAPTVKRHWYAIHTYSGFENKVKANLEHRIESMDMKDRIFQVVVPMEDEIQIRGGVRTTVQKKIYPATCSSTCTWSQRAGTWSGTRRASPASSAVPPSRA